MAATQPPDDYIAEELLWCLVCSSLMVPAPRVDGTRYYSCGLDCPQPDLRATAVEQDLMLPALVRAYVVLYGVGRTGEHPSDDEEVAPGIKVAFTGATPWRPQGELLVSAEERNAWLRCDPQNHRAVLLTAYVRVTVDVAGTVNPVWRHAEVAYQASGATTRW
ncbi:MAG: hypothetical protein ACRDT4_12160 [Micromonosporaceae bacterium]